MRLALDILEKATSSGVTISEEDEHFIFRGSGKETLLSVARLKAFTNDGLNNVAREQIDTAIRRASGRKLADEYPEIAAAVRRCCP